MPIVSCGKSVVRRDEALCNSCACVPACATALEEVKDTYHDVRRLEASILELHKMFMDLALLVDRQGEMLDQIEYQVRGNKRRVCKR